MSGSRAWHVITGEYPPQIGGVSDYTYSVVKSLAAEREEVHVWCPLAPQAAVKCPGVTVHGELGQASGADLRNLDQALERFPGPRQILVEWVPHAFGFRSMNVRFCLWLWRRAARCGDHVDLMVHEPFLSFGEGSWRMDAVAVVHRFLTMVLLRAASRVWVSIPSWERLWRPYTLGRKVPFQWLPIPSNIAVAEDPAGVRALRRRYAPEGELIIGNFGMYGPTVERTWGPILSALEARSFPGRLLLIGTGSEECRNMIARKAPSLSSRVCATGPLAAAELSCHLSACDLFVQPYPDGVSSRRTSFMAGLSHGKPIVTTSGPATEPLWAESGAVALVPRGAPGAFVESFERLCADEQERLRMGNAARKLYQERFDLRHVIARLRQVEDRETTCAF
jgi:glycosyltransferase involved in cell wall biosynthesis